MDRKKIKLFYEILLMISSLIVVIFTVLQLLLDLSSNTYLIMTIIDGIIYFIFLMDYFVRLIFSENKWKFVKDNKIELFAIIPFSLLFRVFSFIKVLKFIKIFRVSKILRASAFISVFSKKIRRVFHTNNFIFVILITLALIFTCAGLIAVIEDLKFIDAVWWSFVTATAVGYGDIAPTSVLGRSVAVILMITGIVFMGMLSGTVTTYFLRKDNKNLKIGYKNEVLNNIKDKLDNFDELTEDELKEIISVLKALKNI